MLNSATLLDNGDGTAYYDYHPETEVRFRRGPMPYRVARDWVMFLNGVEPPATGGLAADTRRALGAYNEESY